MAKLKIDVNDLHKYYGKNEVLKGIIDSDEGSKHLGEVALIPYHSPINELKTLFYNTLYLFYKFSKHSSSDHTFIFNTKTIISQSDQKSFYLLKFYLHFEQIHIY